MNDAELVGLWSDYGMYIGSMEGVDLVFMTDGVGRWVWSNPIASEQVLFRWSARDQRLEISEQRSIHFHNMTDPPTVTEDHDRDDSIHASYHVGPGHDAVGDPVTLLKLDQHIGYSGDRFALIRRELELGDDPAGWTLR
ncbi:hypothetical protein [Amycolatopsis thermoflava]|uniref:hypothetical protein n=1 Tax=Amycolatopsis thermoflava TaxID=84480 RepID=UPI0038014633